MTYRIVILQDGTYDLLDECRFMQLSDEDYERWADMSGDIDDLVIDTDAAGNFTDTITINVAWVREAKENLSNEIG